jgi:hypothetical protein
MLDKPTDSGSALDAERDLPRLSEAALNGRPRRNPLGDLLFSPIDKAKTVVLDDAPELERGASQVRHFVNRPSGRLRAAIDLGPHDPETAATSHAARRPYVIDPVANS